MAQTVSKQLNQRELDNLIISKMKDRKSCTFFNIDLEDLELDLKILEHIECSHEELNASIERLVNTKRLSFKISEVMLDKLLVKNKLHVVYTVEFCT